MRGLCLRRHQRNLAGKRQDVAETVQRTSIGARPARRQQDRPQQRAVTPSLFRKVTKEKGEELANLLKLKYVEVSAKTGKRVSDLFEEILDVILQ